MNNQTNKKKYERMLKFVNAVCVCVDACDVWGEGERAGGGWPMCFKLSIQNRKCANLCIQKVSPSIFFFH